MVSRIRRSYSHLRFSMGSSLQEECTTYWWMLCSQPTMEKVLVVIDRSVCLFIYLPHCISRCSFSVWADAVGWSWPRPQYLLPCCHCLRLSCKKHLDIVQLASFQASTFYHFVLTILHRNRRATLPLLYTVVYCDILWHTVVYCSVLWYIVVYCDVLWYTVIYCDIL